MFSEEAPKQDFSILPPPSFPRADIGKKEPETKPDILPPPSPFPTVDLGKAGSIKAETAKIKEKPLGIEEKLPSKKKLISKIKEKISFKSKKDKKSGVDTEIEQLEKDLLQIPKPGEEPVQSTKEEKPVEITGEPLPGLEPTKIEKPHEVSQAEQEIEKAIKEKLSEHEIKPIEIPKKEPLETPPLPKIEEPLEEPPLPKIEEPTDDITTIKHQIHDAGNALMDFDLDKAKSIYIRIMVEYTNLSPGKQAKVYERIRDLYNERKHAEGLGG